MPTKIAPTSGMVGDDFTIIDTPQGRLAPGAVALFKNGGVTAASATLTTHGPQMTAQGIVPSGLSGGVTYDVSVEVSGQSFGVGTFQVIGTVYTPPSISPTQGPVGSLFTISDPQKRIQQADEARFYLPGGDPLTGTPATGTTVAGDGSQLTAYVPAVTEDVQYMVALVSTADSTIRFQELSYYVTL